MSLGPGLRGVLTIIVDGLLEGTLSPHTDYGTFPYRNSLINNGHGDADDVLAFLNEKIQQLTAGEHSVVYSERKYFSSSTNSGLTFAYVPTGEDASSRSATYFGIAAGSNGVYFADRASDESIAESELSMANYARQRVQREAGEEATAKLLGVVQRRVGEVILQRSPSLTAEQREDINAVAGVYPYDEPLSTFFKRVNSLSLEKLFTVLAIVGQGELPSY